MLAMGCAISVMSAAKEEFAFISDVHSNLEALLAVLDEVGDRELYCLGDIVGYGASPNEVIGLLRKRNATCIMGNHDFAAVNADPSGFNSRAAVAAVWTSRQPEGLEQALPCRAPERTHNRARWRDGLHDSWQPR